MQSRRDNRLRSEKIITYLEPVIHIATTNYCNQQSITYSEYIRALIIKDIRERGLLTDEMLLQIV